MPKPLVVHAAAVADVLQISTSTVEHSSSPELYSELRRRLEEPKNLFTHYLTEHSPGLGESVEVVCQGFSEAVRVRVRDVNAFERDYQFEGPCGMSGGWVDNEKILGYIEFMIGGESPSWTMYAPESGWPPRTPGPAA
jgi:hypothetical protein